jgi:hypothetical protein
MLARQMHRSLKSVEYDVIGGNAKTNVTSTKGQMYRGPEWFVGGGGNDDIYTGIYR